MTLNTLFTRPAGRIALAFLLALAAGYASAHASPMSNVDSDDPPLRAHQGFVGANGLWPGRQLYLPSLDTQDRCDLIITVQNLSAETSKAVLLTWGEPGICGAEASGPLKVECTGLLVPGGSWRLLGAQIPAGSRSGLLVSFSARQLSDFGMDRELGFDDVIADLMCETLFFGLVGDVDDYRRFKRAYDAGLKFAGISQELAVGGSLSALVESRCEMDETAYAALDASQLGRPASQPDYRYAIPALWRESEQNASRILVQNAGMACASLELWFQAQDDICREAQLCLEAEVAPGETVVLDSAGCFEKAGIGADLASAELRSSQPSALVVLDERSGTRELYGIDGRSGPSLVAPLVNLHEPGAAARLHLSNASASASIVRITLRDLQGQEIRSWSEQICPRSGLSQDLATEPEPGDPAPAAAASLWIDSERDRSLSAVLEVSAANGPGLPERRGLHRVEAAGRGLGEQGVLALPFVRAALPGSARRGSLLHVLNRVQEPGLSELGLYLTDANGFLEMLCLSLPERAVERIDLDNTVHQIQGFRGGLIVSGQSWRHAGTGPVGERLPNRIDLAAATLGEGFSGSAYAAAGLQLGETWLGSDLPRCPGAGAIPPDAPTPRPSRTPMERPPSFSTPTPIGGEPLPPSPPGYLEIYTVSYVDVFGPGPPECPGCDLVYSAEDERHARQHPLGKLSFVLRNSQGRVIDRTQSVTRDTVELAKLSGPPLAAGEHYELELVAAGDWTLCPQLGAVRHLAPIDFQLGTARQDFHLTMGCRNRSPGIAPTPITK